MNKLEKDLELHAGNVEDAAGGGTCHQGTLDMALITGEDHDYVQLAGCELYTTLGSVREIMSKAFGITPAEYAGLNKTRQNEISDKISRRLRREYRKQVEGNKGGIVRVDYGRRRDETKEQIEGRRERTRIHVELRKWADGELRLEKPLASSLHHLIRYNSVYSASNKSDDILGNNNNMQCIVVQHDWASSVPPTEVGEEWRVPFPLCCWEFRISGVRVLAFTYEASRDFGPGEIGMFMVYGWQKHWVADDYLYNLYDDKMSSKCYDSRLDNREFRRVAVLVRREIRASCIMLDAQVCQRESVAPEPGLLQKAKRENVPVPRTYSVVRLIRERQRAYRTRTKVAIASSRSPQRGHWRRGTWVHYDDQDSGEVQYVNDGGFVVSKTWRRWHFAGDPNNIIEREYRL